jgi:hypothetical protein
LGTAVFDERFGRPGKHVDEPRRHRHALRVDHRFRLVGRIFAHAGDAIAAQGDIHHARFLSRAVINSAALDDDIELVGCGRIRAEDKRTQREQKEKGEEDFGNGRAKEAASIIHT